MYGWTGKRLCIDLDTQRSWVEEIPAQDLEQFVGGRGLNGKFFLDLVSESSGLSSGETPIALGVGPLTGTPAPCSGWTSISTFSSLDAPPRYLHSSLPGHWGPQLKFAGFDQLILYGRADAPVYVVVDGEKARVESAHLLSGKDTVETTVALQEIERDRDLEVLCIGPAGEKGVAFANVTHRCSWTADHAGLGAAFGTKHLKAVAVRGNRPVRFRQPDLFLQRCLSLQERIRRDPAATRLRDEGTFLFLGAAGADLGMRNYSESSDAAFEDRWRIDYLTNHYSGREGCFSCPVHCGRISEVNGTYLGGVRFEGSWSLGPRIGITDWDPTLRILRRCQLLGLDPSSVGSLVSWVIDCSEKGVFSNRDLGMDRCDWGDEETLLRLIDLVVNGSGIGEVLRQGPFRAAKRMGKGMEWVPHFRGLDLPARDPRSSQEFALGRFLFPGEWDDLQSFLFSPPDGTVARSPEDGLLMRVMSSERLRMLADIHALCPLVLARLPLIRVTDLEGLVSAATGGSADTEASILRTMRVEQTLMAQSPQGEGAVPDRFLKALPEDLKTDDLAALSSPPFLRLAEERTTEAQS